jgi:hypothetical protein
MSCMIKWDACVNGNQWRRTMGAHFVSVDHRDEGLNWKELLAQPLLNYSLKYLSRYLEYRRPKQYRATFFTIEIIGGLFYQSPSSRNIETELFSTDLSHFEVYSLRFAA